MAHGKHIVVIGAGVTGLEVARQLLRAGYAVTVIAKHLPGDKSVEYTSPWAGAQWRTHAAADDLRQHEWDVTTYREWQKIYETEKEGSRESGLQLYDSQFYWASPNPEITSEPTSVPWWSSSVLDFKKYTATELPDNIYAGCVYKAFTLNPPKYLTYLARNVEQLGGQIFRAELPVDQGLSAALKAATELVQKQTTRQIDAFVNATGLGAGKLVPDDAVYPIRGQTVTVRGEASKLITVEDAHPPAGKQPSVTYIIPRVDTGTSILGGTKQAGDWNSEPDPAVTEAILSRCKQWAPELLTGPNGKFEVLSVQVGFRPGRKGGARIEVERVEESVVCHCYGHAGAGYQNSYGSAASVVQELRRYLERS